MILAFRHLTLIAILSAATLALNGCLISDITGSTSGGLTMVQATATLLKQSPCVVDNAAQTTTCTPVIQVQAPGFKRSSF
jgi:hypothetical protein